STSMSRKGGGDAAKTGPSPSTCNNTGSWRQDVQVWRDGTMPPHCDPEGGSLSRSAAGPPRARPHMPQMRGLKMQYHRRAAACSPDPQPTDVEPPPAGILATEGQGTDLSLQ